MTESPWLSRRSIRKYSDQPVADDLVEDFLKAAMAAPSAGNFQPWQFVVIREKSTLEQITTFHSYAAMLKSAQVGILLCADPILQKDSGYWVQDCAAATQNILIAIEASGLGAVWLGIYPCQDRIEASRRLLGIPDSIIPFSLVSIGYPAVVKPPSERYDPSRVHAEKWSRRWS